MVVPGTYLGTILFGHAQLSTAGCTPAKEYNGLICHSCLGDFAICAFKVPLCRRPRHSWCMLWDLSVSFYSLCLLSFLFLSFPFPFFSSIDWPNFLLLPL